MLFYGSVFFNRFDAQDTEKQKDDEKCKRFCFSGLFHQHNRRREVLDLWLQNFQHIGDFKHVEGSIAMKHPDANDVVWQKTVKFVGMVIVKTAYANPFPLDAHWVSSLVAIGHACDVITSISNS